LPCPERQPYPAAGLRPCARCCPPSRTTRSPHHRSAARRTTRSAARRTTRPAARPTRSRPGLQARTHDGALGAATARGRCSPCRLHALGIGRRRISPELTGPAARVRDGAHRISRVELILTGSRWSSPVGRHFFLPFSVGQFSFLPFSVGRWSFLPFPAGQMPGAGA